jgi:acetyl-CoA synthetase
MGEGAWRRFVESFQAGERLPFERHWEVFVSAYGEPSPTGPPCPVWWPDDATLQGSNLGTLMRTLGIESYPELHRWSVENREELWRLVLDRLGIVFDRPPEAIVDLAGGPENPRWLPGARLDITRSCFTADPERTAIVFGREESGALETLTRGALEDLVDRFAGGLRRAGCSPGEAIALYMPMTPECVAAYLGTVRAGCRVVSVADSFSPAELARRMGIAGARAVVTLHAYRRAGREIGLYAKVREAFAALEGQAAAIVLGDGRLEEGDVAWEDFLAPEATGVSFAAPPEHMTNILFSSGTTGTPKAIPWTAITPLKCGLDGHVHHDIHPGDVVCWPTNVGWMMGPWLIYASLLNDATMALYEGAPAGEGFARFVRESGVAMLGVVPSMVRSWRAGDTVKPGEWTGVRVFSSTGEASSPEDYLWLMSRADYRAPVIEYLGGTEIGGGHITGTVVQPASPSTFTTPALGTDFVILDERDAPVDVGGTGELYLLPPALGLSQALLNADHHAVYYRDCPAGPGGAVLRRHGDQVARLADGCYRALGRADDTMNLGGIKVSSVELERAVNDHPAVYESAAVAVPPPGGGADRLVVFVVLEGEEDRDALKEDLQKAVASRLNPLFRIHDVEVVQALPRTASNKIMRRELRAGYES